ncbi:MAG TPA: septal ring lytic transglycosylase RlpA family protein [Xanthobacteraceae bacterium]|jgi:rare lipoprotein A|nr:septal ring lytic transglycosylase RlpA family protein [Xanthobacteraceae bacterium]
MIGEAGIQQAIIAALLLTHWPIKRPSSPQNTSTPRRSQIVTTARESALKVRSICLVTAVLQILPLATISSQALAQSGIASVYSTESGSRTASGARLDPRALTAAHRSLPFGSRVVVTNRANGRSVVVTVNDRGPFVRGRIIDVTPAAAHALGFSGTAPVTVERE